MAKTKPLPRWRQRLWVEQDHRCHYCHARIAHDEATLDHVVPRAYGGPDAWYNLVVACGSCNSDRGHALDHCSCQRCTGAVSEFHRIRSGNRRPVQKIVYMGDRHEVATALTELERRRDKLLIHADNEELDEATRIAARSAAHAYDQTIGILTRPIVPRAQRNPAA